ncbi:MAG: hypothetical protein JWM52_507 [Candidatus Saccharibacteria bacterium]|nr:hypothetical protein [Candidatus Saccharibacteria bacterium]
MNIKQKLKHIIVGTVLAIGVAVFTSFVPAPPTSAVDCVQSAQQNCCGGVETGVISCTQDGTGGVQGTGAWGILLLAINILTAGVGIATLGGIIYASILYTSSGGSPEQTKKAMTIITNIVIGVVAYAGMYALLNFLIPGGLFAN